MQYPAAPPHSPPSLSPLLTVLVVQEWKSLEAKEESKASEQQA